MNFFEKEIRKYFSQILIEYKYTLQYIDDTTTLLTSDTQSFMFTFDRDGVDLDIILKNKFNIFEQYPLSAYVILERFKSSKDCPHESEPENFEQRISLSLCIFSYGLYNYCKDILSGDTTWLKRLQYKDPEKWTSDRVDEKIIPKIKNAFKNNIFNINKNP